MSFYPILGVGATGVAGIAGGSSSSKKSASTFDALFAEFKKLAAENPFERIRDSILKKHGTDEEGYNKMSPDQRKAIDQEIAQAIHQAQAQPVAVRTGRADTF